MENTETKSTSFIPVEVNDDSIDSDFYEGLICPLLVGVAGGSASGKTTLCNKIIHSLSQKECLTVSFDSFYKTPPPNTDFSQYNFDHPDSIDFDLCYLILKKLLFRHDVEIPEYSFKEHRRLETTTKVVDTYNLILIEGILAFHDPRIVNLMNLKIFVSCDNDIRLYRRVQRDVNERGRDVSGILYQYNKFVKPAYEQFIEPSMKHANIIVPGNSDNSVAINFIIQNLRSQLARVDNFKKTMKSHNFYSAEILDSVWLNFGHEEKRTSENLALYMAEQILFLRDQSTKIECLNLMNLFTAREEFSKTLYLLVMGRYLSYAVKMMKRYHSGYIPDDYGVLHLGTQEDTIKNDKIKVLSIIVPFFDQPSEEKVKARISSSLEKYPTIEKIFVLAIFSNINTMTDIIKWNQKIFVVNIMCIVDMQTLKKSLRDFCKVRDFDFVGNENLVSSMIDNSYREIARKEKK